MKAFRVSGRITIFGAESAILDNGLFTQRVARPASMIMINSTCNSAGDSTRATRAVPRAARIMNRWYCRRPAKPCRPSDGKQQMTERGMRQEEQETGRRLRRALTGRQSFTLCFLTYADRKQRW